MDFKNCLFIAEKSIKIDNFLIFVNSHLFLIFQLFSAQTLILLPNYLQIFSPGVGVPDAAASAAVVRRPRHHVQDCQRLPNIRDQHRPQRLHHHSRGSCLPYNLPSVSLSYPQIIVYTSITQCP